MPSASTTAWSISSSRSLKRMWNMLPLGAILRSFFRLDAATSKSVTFVGHSCKTKIEAFGHDRPLHFFQGRGTIGRMQVSVSRNDPPPRLEPATREVDEVQWRSLCDACKLPYSSTPADVERVLIRSTVRYRDGYGVTQKREFWIWTAIPEATIINRLNRGWSNERALTPGDARRKEFRG